MARVAEGLDSPVSDTAEIVVPTVTSRPRTGTVVAYLIMMFTINLAAMTPALMGLALKIQIVEPRDKEGALGAVVAIGSVVGIAAGPVAALLSDRCRLGWGRRRPFIVVGVAFSALGAGLMIPATSVAMVGAGWGVASVGAACAGAGIGPFVAEVVPPDQRGRVAALAGMAVQLAGVAAALTGALLASKVVLLFGVPVAVLAVGSLVYLVAVPDGVVARRSSSPPRPSQRSQMEQILFGPNLSRFAWLLAGKFFMQLAVGFFTTYQLYFVLDRFGMDPAQAAHQMAVLAVVGIAVAAASAFAAGAVSDRLGRRQPMIYLGGSTVAAGMVGIALSHSLLSYGVAVMAMLGGIGTFSATDLALAAELIPDGSVNVGGYMAMYAIAGGMATSVAPLLAPMILRTATDGAGYTTLFLVASVSAALTIPTIRMTGRRSGR
jgi:MFS family permease